MSAPTSGRWQVTTESDSVYVLDMDAMTLTRQPGEDAENLRKDGTVVPLLKVVTLREGASMLLAIDVRGDGVVTYRFTTPVVSVTELAHTGSLSEPAE